jgi:protein-S-isoprenylcysteine O-methyltransferase Ste14
MKPLIPPPVIGIVIAIAIVAGAHALPGWRWQAPVLVPLGSALIAIALLIEVISVLSFIRARTTINPLAPERSAALVTGGLYRISRNPMYLGMACLLVGICAIARFPFGFIGVVIFVWLITVLQILPEEKALEARFGEAFTAYRQRVRRWL